MIMYLKYLTLVVVLTTVTAFFADEGKFSISTPGSCYKNATPWGSFYISVRKMKDFRYIVTVLVYNLASKSIHVGSFLTAER